MYKKIYLEITNKCNLKCPFCLHNNREPQFLTFTDYQTILKKIKPYTKYLYLHVSGEPLIHPLINTFIKYGSQDFHINITTNGYLIKRIINNHHIRQINISLHSYNPAYNISLKKYLDNILEVINNLSSSTYFSLRFWVNNKYNQPILNYLNKYFNQEIELHNGFKIKENVFISIGNEFIWPDLNNTYENPQGTCYALKDHIGILVDGTIIPCCLDANGVINLGNIFQSDLESIIKSPRYQKMLKSFQNNYKYEALCQKCNYLDVMNNCKI